MLERIVVETRGNPLALLELPRGLTPAQLAGGFGLPAALPLSARIEESFTRRLARLPRDARRLLLVAAADPTGDLAPCLAGGSAARDPGVGRAAPSNRTACWRSARAWCSVIHWFARPCTGRPAPDERSEVHRALAEATDPEIDPDRRAWHRAQAASMPDEDVAAELERSAARAQARGGFAAAAAFLERSSVVDARPRASRRPGSRRGRRQSSRRVRSTRR